MTSLTSAISLGPGTASLVTGRSAPCSSRAAGWSLCRTTAVAFFSNMREMNRSSVAMAKNLNQMCALDSTALGCQLCTATYSFSGAIDAAADGHRSPGLTLLDSGRDLPRWVGDRGAGRQRNHPGLGAAHLLCALRSGLARPPQRVSGFR